VRGQAAVTWFKLQPLDEGEIRACMANWLKAQNIPDAAVNLIREKSAGNPLFSQELCILLRNKKIFNVVDGTCEVNGDLEPGGESYEIPNTITALMTR
jgi:predicted ATPase